MTKLTGRWKELGLALAIVLLNAFFVLQVVGVSYDNFSWKAFAQAYAPETGCADGIDNNGDGRTDCADPTCASAPNCATQAPAMGPGGTITAAVALLLIGGAALRRVRRPS